MVGKQAEHGKALQPAIAGLASEREEGEMRGKNEGERGTGDGGLEL